MTADALLEEAFAHHGAGRLERAETLYREILEQDEENLNALQLLGAIAIDSQRAEEAVTWLSRAAGVLQSFGKPAAQHAALYHNLGNALAAVGCSAETIASYRRGLELDPDMPELSARLAAALVQQGDLAAAATHYQTAVRLRPGHTGWLRNLGNIEVALQQPEAAVERYRRVLAHDPNDAAAQLALGLTLAVAATSRGGDRTARAMRGQPSRTIRRCIACSAEPNWKRSNGTRRQGISHGR